MEAKAPRGVDGKRGWFRSEFRDQSGQRLASWNVLVKYLSEETERTPKC